MKSLFYAAGLIVILTVMSGAAPGPVAPPPHVRSPQNTRRRAGSGRASAPDCRGQAGFVGNLGAD